MPIGNRGQSKVSPKSYCGCTPILPGCPDANNQLTSLQRWLCVEHPSRIHYIWLLQASLRFYSTDPTVACHLAAGSQADL